MLKTIQYFKNNSMHIEIIDQLFQTKLYMLMLRLLYIGNMVAV